MMSLIDVVAFSYEDFQHVKRSMVKNHLKKVLNILIVARLLKLKSRGNDMP
jgi:hypothetical protein